MNPCCDGAFLSSWIISPQNENQWTKNIKSFSEQQKKLKKETDEQQQQSLKAFISLCCCPQNIFLMDFSAHHLSLTHSLHLSAISSNDQQLLFFHSYLFFCFHNAVYTPNSKQTQQQTNKIEKLFP